MKAGAAATHTLATDTLRFTAQTQLRALSLTGRDAYGNDSPLGFTGFTSNLVDMITSGQNISLKSRTRLATHARGWARFDWASGPSDSVAIIVDLAPASATVVGLDTLVGAVVGQKLAVAFDVRDSLNQPIEAPDVTGPGTSLSSSNPSVAAADAATDTITALAIGKTIITASLGGSQFSGTLAVYNRWDVGPFSQLYAGLADAMYSRVLQTLYDDGGTSIETIGHLPHSANPSSGMEVDSHGAHSWTDLPTLIIAMGLAPTGQVYLLDSTNAVLHGLDPNTGLDLWTLATPGAAALETTLDGDAIVRSPTSLTRVSAAGHATWSVALSSPAQHVAVGPTSVFAIAADQISAISLSGTRLWSAAVTTYAFATDRSGGLYVTTTTPELIALSPSGTEQWRVSLTSQPRLIMPTSAGTVVLLGQNGTLTALNQATGGVVWSRPLGAIVINAAATDNGLLVVAVRDYLFKIDAATGAVISRTSSLPSGFASPTLRAGHLYITGVVDGAVTVTPVEFGPYR